MYPIRVHPCDQWLTLLRQYLADGMSAVGNGHRPPGAVRHRHVGVDAEVIDSMCSGGDSYALAGFSGFKPTALPNDWLEGIL